MKKYCIILLLAVIIISSYSCRKRNNEFAFAGVWEIQKVEMIKYKDGNKTWDTLITDTAGWFAFQLATGFSGQGKMGINYSSFSGLSTSNDVSWEIDEHTGERLLVNGIQFTREHIAAGEKWNYMMSNDFGTEYWRETLYVKHK
jgi:hypothetical protein